MTQHLNTQTQAQAAGSEAAGFPLALALAQLASLQGHAVPWFRFAAMARDADSAPFAELSLASQAGELWLARFPGGGVREFAWPATPDDTPALWIGPLDPQTGKPILQVVQGVRSGGVMCCIEEQGQGLEIPASMARQGRLLTMKADLQASPAAGAGKLRSASDWFRHTIARRRMLFMDAVLATLTINAVGLAASFYSMQVYDRVLPSMGYATLWVMTVGVLLAIGLELAMRHLRARLTERACKAIDLELSSVFFSHALAIRMDQRPHTVGTFAAQIRQFELVRNFLTASTMFVLADAPFAVLFIAVMALIAGPVALVPLVMVPLSVVAGLMFIQPLARRAKAHMAQSNQKNGLLIEAIDGIESVKAASGEWRMLARWQALTNLLADDETAIKDLSSLATNLTQTLQQLGYVGLVAAGAYAIGSGALTVGGLIACTLISGRALGPLAQIPSLVVQWQHARYALAGLDQIMSLPADSQPAERRLVPDACQGRLRLESLRHGWSPDLPALQLASLVIRPGERVAVLGAIGSGKSTLLKLLSGLYRPAEGRAFLDDVDIANLAPGFVREHIGYLPQDVRLFQGTLRDNLTLGLPLPTDRQILEAARFTGLDHVIAAHPRGLGLEISEGGRGLSGGQRQLAGLTRLVLARPRIMLLDEPTAAMDAQLEEFIAEGLFGRCPADATLVVVTHKPALLRHFSRIIVIDRGKLVADGPREEVLHRLRQLANPRPPPASAAAAHATEAALS